MKMKQGVKELLIISGTLLGAIGYMTGVNQLGEIRSRVRKIYAVDVNRDGLNDLVVESPHTPLYLVRYDIFLAEQDSNGAISYKPLSEIKKRTLDSLGIQLDHSISHVNASIDRVVRTAKRLVRD